MDPLRTFVLDLKEQLAQTLTAYATSILAHPRQRLNAEEAVEPPLRQIIDVLQQVMCAHDAEKLAISVLEIYDGGLSRRARFGSLSPLMENNMLARYIIAKTGD